MIIFQCFLKVKLIKTNEKIKNLNNLCQFIETTYKTKNMLDGVICTKEMLYNIGKISKSKKNKYIIYLMQNLRMTICELG